MDKTFNSEDGLVLSREDALLHVAQNIKNGLPDGHWLIAVSYSSIQYVDNVVSGIAHGAKYRLKPRTRMLNGFEVPAPLDVMPEVGVKYFSIHLCSGNGISKVKWSGSSMDFRIFELGFAFATKEDAIANFKAICGEDPNK